MKRIRDLSLMIVAACATAAPASAQADYSAVSRVAMFERAVIGDVELSPVNIVEDSRCVDPRICFRDDDLIITAVLHGYGPLIEVDLRLGYATPVPGGDLILRGAGTPPARNGAIPFRNYRFEIEFVPLP